MYIVKIIFQMCILVGSAMLGNKITQVFNLHVPGSMVGIFLIFFLLETKMIRLEWLEAGANILIGELILFFIPSAVGVVQYRQVMIANGASFALVIFLSTVTVMLCTGFLAELISKRKGTI